MANKPGEANFFPDVPQFPSMGTFQPVYGKFDLTTYIQGASDYEIMAFLVGKYNACLEAYGNITKLSTDTITACKQLQDWINSWFTNLDVQEELNNKINSMVQDGSFGQLLHQTFDTQINQQTTNAVTAWLIENVTPAGSAVVVDKSLSIEGAAADSKATGNKFTILQTVDEIDCFNRNIQLGLFACYKVKNGPQGVSNTNIRILDIRKLSNNIFITAFTDTGIYYMNQNTNKWYTSNAYIYSNPVLYSNLTDVGNYIINGNINDNIEDAPYKHAGANFVILRNIAPTNNMNTLIQQIEYFGNRTFTRSIVNSVPSTWRTNDYDTFGKNTTDVDVSINDLPNGITVSNINFNYTDGPNPGLPLGHAIGSFKINEKLRLIIDTDTYGNIYTKLDGYSDWKSTYPMALVNRKMSAYGDSITAGYALPMKENGYAYLIALKNCFKINNKAVPGIGFAYPINNQILVDTIDITELRESNFVLVACGINDYASGTISLGEFGDTGHTSLYGYIDEAFAKIYNNATSATIAILTPLDYFPNGKSAYDTKNSRGFSIRDIATAIEKTAEKYGIYTINQHNLHLVSEKTYANRYTDFTHPNAEFSKILAQAIDKKLNF